MLDRRCDDSFLDGQCEATQTAWVPKRDVPLLSLPGTVVAKAKSLCLFVLEQSIFVVGDREVNRVGTSRKDVLEVDIERGAPLLANEPQLHSSKTPTLRYATKDETQDILHL